MSNSQRPATWMVILAFGLVYVFWGATYTAIDIAVEHIPPALMCGIRFLVAGLVMLTFCGLRGQKIRFTPVQLSHLAVVGILLLMGGNLTLAYVEQYLPSGLAALLLAGTPLWFLVLDSLLLGDHRISQRGIAGLGLGIVGTLVLIWPQLISTTRLGHKDLWLSLTLLAGSFSWALGSVLSKKWQSGAPSFAATAWQMIFAGLANLIFAFFLGEPSRAVWTARGLGAMVYLIIGGSLVGYTAYIWLLAHVPTSKVSTYAYVNPVVAVFLGWLVLHEKVDVYIVIGSAIVIASVALVTSAKVKTRTVADEMAAVEAAS